MLAGPRKAFNREAREENPRRSPRKTKKVFFATFAAVLRDLRG
jgi:hypothetical protein